MQPLNNFELTVIEAYKDRISEGSQYPGESIRPRYLDRVLKFVYG